MYSLSLKHLFSVLVCIIVIYRTKMYPTLSNISNCSKLDWRWLLFIIVLFFITPDIFILFLSLILDMVFSTWWDARPNYILSCYQSWGSFTKYVALYLNISFIVFYYITFNILIFGKGFVSKGDMYVFLACFYILWFVIVDPDLVTK